MAENIESKNPFEGMSPEDLKKKASENYARIEEIKKEMGSAESQDQADMLNSEMEALKNEISEIEGSL